MTRLNPWLLAIAALCPTLPAEAARDGRHYGYRCVLANGGKVFALQDLVEQFPQAVHRCSRVHLTIVQTAVEGKEPRIVHDYTSDTESEPDPAYASASHSEPEDDIPELEPVAYTRKAPESSNVKAAFRKLIVEASWRNELDPELVQAVIQVESAYRPNARSPKGALGLMQVMPATGARFGVSQPHQLLDPARNIDVGTRYLRYLHKMFKGRTDLILAAYNAGEGAVARYGNRIPPYPETREYVRRALKIYRDRRQ